MCFVVIVCFNFFFLVASDIQNMQQALHDSEKKANTYMKRYSRVQVGSLFVLMNVSDS